MKKYFFVSILFWASHSSTFATHLRAGYISYKRINGLTFEVTINAFVNIDPNETSVQFGLGILDFGDGIRHTTNTTPSTPLPYYPFVGVVRYSILHTYPGDGHYLISYAEKNRNADIINMSNSVGTTFYIDSFLILDSENPQLNSTPEFVAPPAFHYDAGTPISVSYAMRSDQNLFFDYRLVTPMQIINNKPPAVETSYTLPENAQINPVNGLFTWDAKYHGFYEQGEFTFAIKVRMWAKDETGTEIYLGSMTFDTQIILENLEEVSPVLTTKLVLDDNGRIYIPLGTSKSIKFFYQPVGNASNVLLKAYSELEAVEGAYAFTTYDSATVPPGKVGLIQLNSTESISRERPYIITLRGSESPNFKTDRTLMIYTQDVYPEVITGIEKPPSPLKLFPIPVADVLTIEGGEDTRKIQLINYAGSTIKTWVNESQLNMGEIPLGLYLLKVETAGGVQIQRIVKK